MISPDDDNDDDDRQTRSLAGMALVLALLVIGLFLVQKLAATSALQDCILEGRTNCAPIDVSHLQ
ncbi:MAG TPA: hypothetical protein VM689_13695 [Aliidongia sp.]|nr:hypothetical protein [Aliidongia sp.]